MIGFNREDTFWRLTRGGLLLAMVIFIFCIVSIEGLKTAFFCSVFGTAVWQFAKWGDCGLSDGELVRRNQIKKAMKGGKL